MLFCNSGCEQATVETGSQSTNIEAQVDIWGGETASFSFQVVVSPGAALGSTYNITTYLLGGVNTAGGSETAFATLTVTEPVAGSGPVDEREVWLNVTPRLLRVAPGGSGLYLIRPSSWGDWSADRADYTVEVRLPAGVSLPRAPICGPGQPTVPKVSTCDIEAEERSDGETVITARPGFAGGHANGIYLTLSFDPTLPIDTKLRIHTFLKVSIGAPPAAAGAYQPVNAVVVDPSEMPAPGESGVLYARLEMTSNFSHQGNTCTKNGPSGGTELVLYEWGLTTELARIDMPTGRIGSASTGTGAEVCIIDIRFADMLDSSMYVLAQVAAGETFACRACVLGLVTSNVQAEQVFVLDR